MSVGIAIVSRNGLAKWKRLRQTIAKAHQLGLEVGLAVDPRSTDGTQRLAGLADTYISYESRPDEVHERGTNALLEAMRSDIVVRIDDDEEPSRTFWEDIGTFRPDRAYVVPVLCFLGHKLYQRGMDHQVRVFPRNAFRFAGGVNSDMLVTVPAEARPLDIIWHYALYAPREERDAKAARYRRLDITEDFMSRFLYERHMDDFIDMAPGMEEELPEDPHQLRVGRELLGDGLAVQ